MTIRSESSRRSVARIRGPSPGASNSLIRPFRLGDIFLLQRLGGQAVTLNPVQSLLFPRPAVLTALSAIIPGGDGKVSTYVLIQDGHRLVRAGFLQAQKRAGRPEADILLLAPALEVSAGHPVIWKKLLHHYAQEAAQQQIERIYADAPDQPLPVSTFAQAGFRVYARQTIWRLVRDQGGRPSTDTKALIRLQQADDDWELTRLYRRMTPAAVRLAQGEETEEGGQSLILRCAQQSGCFSFVMERQREVIACVQIRSGRRGVWVDIWADMLDPEQRDLRALLDHALAVVREQSMRFPVYMGVCDYHGGLGSVLEEYGFAPFTDRARMVKAVKQWVREAAPAYAPALAGVGEVIPTQFVIPEEQYLHPR